jgi:hypothetical protein
LAAVIALILLALKLLAAPSSRRVGSKPRMLHYGISSSSFDARCTAAFSLATPIACSSSSSHRWFPSILKLITVVHPETLVRWHREGFRRYWRGKSRRLGGRPPIGAELRALIRRMSLENPLWGAPRIHGELLKLGFAVAPSTVGKYMAAQPASDQPFDIAALNTIDINDLIRR